MAVVKKKARRKVSMAKPDKPNPVKVKKGAVTLSSSLQLPTAKTEVETDLARYSILVYGPPKIGKSSCLASFPHPLFFFFEVGGKGLEVYRFPPDQECIETWDQVIRGVDLLETTDKFANVVFDTGAAAYSLCLEACCKELRIPDIGSDTSGKKDRSAKGWKLLEREFYHQINRIQRTGRAVHFTAHSKVQQIESRSGEFTRIIPRFTGQCERIITPLVDHIFFIDYYRLTAGGVGRVLLTKGDDLVQAGHKSGKVAPMPRYILLPEDKPDDDYKVIAAAFRGELEGLRPEDLKASATTSDAGAEMLETSKDDAARAALAAARGGAEA